MKPEVLFVVRADPSREQVATEVLSEILTFAAFDVRVSLLFLGEGVRFLAADIAPALSGMMASLDFYGVEELFADRESLEAFSVSEENIPMPVTILKPSDISSCLRRHAWIIGD